MVGARDAELLSRLRRLAQQTAAAALGSQALLGAFQNGEVGEDSVLEAALRERAHFRGCSLTRRQIEVSLLLAKGFTEEKIATQLFVSRSTANTHIDGILARTDFGSRHELRGWCQGILLGLRLRNSYLEVT